MTPGQPWDLVIVGASIGGLSVAYNLPENFGNVLIIEKKPEIGTPVQCAEYVPRQATQDIPELERFVAQPIAAMETIFPSGAREIAEYKGFILNRDRLEQYLAAVVQKRGIHFLTNLRVWELAPNGVKLFDDRIIEAPVVVGADGASSRIGSSINAPVQYSIMAVQYTVKMTNALTNTRIYFHSRISGGYGWVFPKGGVAHVGLGIGTEMLGGYALWDTLDWFLCDRVAEGIVTDKVVGKTGGKLPASGIVSRLAAEPGESAPLCFLVGDAAGLCDPITGAGILSAWQSGKILARMLPGIRSGEKKASDYEDKIRNIFGASLEYKAMARKSLDAHWRSLSDQKLEAALRKIWVF